MTYTYKNSKLQYGAPKVYLVFTNYSKFMEKPDSESDDSENEPENTKEDSGLTLAKLIFQFKADLANLINEEQSLKNLFTA